MTHVTFEGDTSGDQWVMRYTIPLFGIAMERRTVSALPREAGLYFVDFGTRLSPGQSSAALWNGKEWLRTNRKPFKAKVTHWTSDAEGDPMVKMPKLAHG